MSSSKKALFAGISGTVLQWYDFAIFGYFAPLIANAYFPNNNQFISLLSAFGALAVGYLLAPLGAVVFGYIGDHYGRKKALTLSIAFMALATGCMSIVPDYAMIGMAAPILLTLLRIIQGFVASSEFTGSAIFLIEHATPQRKAFYGSLTSSAYSIGSILAGLIASFLTASFMPAWGWRLGFSIAFAAGILVFFLRLYVQETPDYQQISDTEKLQRPFLTAVKENPLAILGVIGIAWLVGIMTFGTYVFTASYLHTYFNLPLSTAALIITLALVVDAVLEPFIALIADNVGYVKIMRIGMLAVLGLSIPIFYGLSSNNLTWIILSLSLMSALIALTFSPVNAYIALLFPKQYRYSGFGVSFHIGISLFGGTAPLAMVWLVKKTGNLISPASYYIFGAIIGLFSLAICELSRQKNSSLSVTAAVKN